MASWLRRLAAWWSLGDDAAAVDDDEDLDGIERVHAFFRRYDTSVYGALGVVDKAPTDVDLDRFERAIGFRLPLTFREFSKSELGGLSLFVRDEIWPPPKPQDVGPAWTFQRGIAVLGLSPVLPAAQDLRLQHHLFEAASGGDLLPFLFVESSADRYCFDREGGICFWHHETGERELVEADFGDVLWSEMEALFERVERRRREGLDPRRPQ